jgi:hypothetical protein
VLAGTISGLSLAITDALAATTLAARVVQTCVHVLLPERNATVAVRFSFFLVQIVAMLLMVLFLGNAALHR